MKAKKKVTFMTMHYNTGLKKKLCKEIYFNRVSTIKTIEIFYLLAEL